MSPRKRSPEELNRPDKEKGLPMPERIIKLRMSLPKPQARTEIRQLPTWAKLACARHEVAGRSWRQIAHEIGRSENAIRVYCQSPAGKAWRKILNEVAEDPVEVARMILKGSAGNLAIENVLHYEAAKKAGELGEAGKQLRFLTETVGVPQPKNEEQKPTQIVINLGGMGGLISAEPPMGESEAHRIEDAEIIEDA